MSIIYKNINISEMIYKMVYMNRLLYKMRKPKIYQINTWLRDLYIYLNNQITISVINMMIKNMGASSIL